MNMSMRYLLSFIACLTVLFAFLLMAGCQNNTADAEASAAPEATAVPTEAPTEEPTEAPTEVPTEEPTPDPTATPVPDGGYVDPAGIIPPTVEILVGDRNTFGISTVWCIANVNGETMLQKWKKSEGLVKEWPVPEDMIRGKGITCYDNAYQDGDVMVDCYLTDGIEEMLYFYQDKEGRTLYFEATSTYASEEKGLLLGTTDGKAIWYHWGDDFYKMHDYGKGVRVEADDGNFCVNGLYYLPQDIKFTNVVL